MKDQRTATPIDATSTTAPAQQGAEVGTANSAMLEAIRNGDVASLMAGGTSDNAFLMGLQTPILGRDRTEHGHRELANCELKLRANQGDGIDLEAFRAWGASFTHGNAEGYLARLDALGFAMERLLAREPGRLGKMRLASVHVGKVLQNEEGYLTLSVECGLEGGTAQVDESDGRDWYTRFDSSLQGDYGSFIRLGAGLSAERSAQYQSDSWRAELAITDADAHGLFAEFASTKFENHVTGAEGQTNELRFGTRIQW